MKSFSLIVFVIYSATAFGQFADDFSDGDFTNGLIWSGDVGLFTVSAGELQSQSSGAATYYLSTPSSLATEAQWDFYVNLKFSTSGANFVDILLMADNADLTVVTDGYFVRVGNTADEISLYKVAANTNQ